MFCSSDQIFGCHLDQFLEILDFEGRVLQFNVLGHFDSTSFVDSVLKLTWH